MIVAVDNDVLKKAACYGLLHDLLHPEAFAGTEVGVLGVAKYVVRSAIARTSLSRDSAAVLGALSAFLDTAVELDTSDEELVMATDLETTAQELGLPLDVGESQLCAITVTRPLAALVTGDKRAIAAIEKLAINDTRLNHLHARIHCLEQAVVSAISRVGAEHVRGAICAEEQVDQALTICMACRSSAIEVDVLLDGLRSYISALRVSAPKVMAP